MFISRFCIRLLTFSKETFSKTIFQEHHPSQMVWIQIRPNVLSDVLTKVAASKGRVNWLNGPIQFAAGTRYDGMFGPRCEIRFCCMRIRSLQIMIHTLALCKLSIMGLLGSGGSRGGSYEPPLSLPFFLISYENEILWSL